jgi:hypothetical protein
VTKKAPSPSMKWTEWNPDSVPPTDCWLMLLSEAEAEEGEAITGLDLGYYSSKLNILLTVDGIAIQEIKEVKHYSPIYLPTGELFLL